MARTRAAKEMREKRATLERESMTVELEQESKLGQKTMEGAKINGARARIPAVFYRRTRKAKQLLAQQC